LPLNKRLIYTLAIEGNHESNAQTNDISTGKIILMVVRIGSADLNNTTPNRNQVWIADSTQSAWGTSRSKGTKAAASGDSLRNAHISESQAYRQSRPGTKGTIAGVDVM
jgi:hypothetical protein